MNIIENIKIEDLAYGPFAVAHDLNGQVIFVENLCPGDIADLEIYDQRKNFAFAHAVSLKEASKLRDLEPRCKLHKICGSCQWQHISYENQLEYKRKNLIDIVSKSKIDFDASTIPNIIPMEDPWNYRNKVIYPVSTVPSTGRLQAGYFKRNSRELINIKFCPIQYSVFDQIMEAIKDLCSKNQITSKVLRHILLRSNYDHSEVLVSFIMRQQGFSDEMKKAIGTISRRIAKDFPQVKTCTINYNDKSTNVILGERTEVILGEGFINEIFEGLKLKISTTSFFQVNSSQFAKIIGLISRHCEERSDVAISNVEPEITTSSTFATLRQTSRDDGEIRILDAYCGIGTISLALAKKFPNLEIIGVEEVPSAIDDAKQNALENNIKAEFFCSTLEDWIATSSVSTSFRQTPRNDVIVFDYTIINPPRKGCTNKVLDVLAKIQSKKIFYVSCNPTTLVRDIKYLEQYGFKTQSLTGIDMFPHTYHVESLAVLIRA